MADVVYGLCVLMSLFCAVLLVRAYRASRGALLLWSALCFVGLAISSMLLLVDYELGDQTNLTLVRAWVSAISMLALVIGLVWSSVEVKR